MACITKLVCKEWHLSVARVELQAKSNKKKPRVCQPFFERATLFIFLLKNGKNASRTRFAALFS